MGFTCTECSDSARGIALTVVLSVAAVIVVLAIFAHLVSGETEGPGQAIMNRLARDIPLQTVKIVIVAWQILTQVREEAKTKCLNLVVFCFRRSHIGVLVTNGQIKTGAVGCSSSQPENPFSEARTHCLQYNSAVRR